MKAQLLEALSKVGTIKVFTQDDILECGRKAKEWNYNRSLNPDLLENIEEGIYVVSATLDKGDCVRCIVNLPANETIMVDVPLDFYKKLLTLGVEE